MNFLARQVGLVAVAVAMLQGGTAEAKSWRLGVALSSAPGGGVYVNKVFKYSPASAIPLFAGDTILAIDGRFVNDPQTVRQYILSPGRTSITLLYEQNGSFWEAEAEFQVVAVAGIPGSYALKKKTVTKRRVADPRHRR